MLSLTNPWILVGILATVVSSFFYGHHMAYVEQEAEIARLNLIEHDKEEQMIALRNAKSRELERANNEAKQKIDKLQSAIADGSMRLSIRTVPTGQDSCAAGGNSESRAQLNPEDAQALVSIAADGDNAIRQLNACIDIYNQVKDKQ